MDMKSALNLHFDSSVDIATIQAQNNDTIPRSLVNDVRNSMNPAATAALQRKKQRAKAIFFCITSLPD